MGSASSLWPVEVVSKTEDEPRKIGNGQSKIKKIFKKNHKNKNYIINACIEFGGK